MKSFDEWYREAKKLNNDGFSAKDFFEAGQQSKQAEVDELKREMTNKTNEAYADGQKSMRKMIKSNEDELQNKYDAMYRAFTVADDCRKEWHRCYVGVRQREDELQKRIDEALQFLTRTDITSINIARDILNGDQS